MSNTVFVFPTPKIARNKKLTLLFLFFVSINRVEQTCKFLGVLDPFSLNLDIFHKQIHNNKIIKTKNKE